MPDPQETTQPIIGIAATRIAGGGSSDRPAPPLDDGTEQPIAMGDILYAFTRGGVRGDAPLILAPWGKRIAFHQATVYIRTGDALYRVGYESLKSFKTLLSPKFQRVNKSVIANLAHVNLLDLKGSTNRVHTVTYTVETNEIGWGLERVRIGREFLNRVRERYGYRRGASDQTFHSVVPPTG